MSDIGKIRIRVPSNVKAGDVVRVRCLVIHPMEIVQRDAQGKIIDRNYNYITRVTATYLGKPVAVFDLTQSVSENPAFSFALKATAPGPVTVTFVDTHGGSTRAGPTSRSPERPMTHLVSTPRRAPAPPGRVRAQGVWGPFRGPQKD